MKPNDEIEVTCSSCNEKRTIKWSAYKKKKEGPPFLQSCRSCASKRILSEETKQKISQALMGRETSDETKKKISDYRKSHPELWTTLRPELGRGKRFMPHTQETKDKIRCSILENHKKHKENKLNEDH